MRRADSLLVRHAVGDLRRNPGVNIALAIVLVLSAGLMATGAMVVERLVGSIDRLFEQAEPPHFLQMHAGAYDRDALDAFAASQPDVEAWTIVDLVGFDGSAISWQRPSTGASGDLSESLIDNLFVAQNADFDHLLDEHGEIVHPADGEVYVPVAYQQRYGFEVGDEIGVRTEQGIEELRVVGFVRDAQMASSLSSGTRFLVSPSQRDALAAGGGDREIIVEYRVHDPARASALQAAYERDPSVPKNGQAVTFDMIRIINAVSDGLVALALVFASAVLVAIALVNLRFVIRGSLEDRVREIGAMKAIGIPDREIRRLYLSTYGLMALLACVVGGALAVGATALLTRGIATSYAQAPVTVWTFLVPLLALGLVALVVLGICAGVLRRVRHIEVVGALVHGSTRSEREVARSIARRSRRVRGASLARGRGSMNERLVRNDLRSEFGQWVLLPAVFFLTVALMTLPANLLSTFESPRFVTSMGAPESDLRADIQFSDGVDAQRSALVEALGTDAEVGGVHAYANVLGLVAGDEGPESVRIEVGDYSGSTIDYVSGAAPRDGEIALSVLNADAYGVGTGDTFTVSFDGVPRTLLVSGVYQDVTSGGRTAKMQGTVDAGGLSYVVYVDLVAGVDPVEVAERYRVAFPDASVIPMRDYVAQTLSYVTDALRTAAIIAFVVGLGVTLLITGLFLRLRMSRDRRKMGVLSAIGFASREIAGQIRAKTVIMAGAGVVLGVLFVATAGGPLIGGLIALAGLGIAELQLTPTAWLAYGAYPIALLAVAFAGAVFLTRSLHRTDKSAWLT